MSDTIVFHTLKDEPAPIGEPLLVRGPGAGGTSVYAIAKYEPSPMVDGWSEFKFMQRNDRGDDGLRLWFRVTAWARLDNADGR